ncbi:alginate lyase family protein [Mucilaginibacter ginsenosidivorax]|uniref:Alginate lyase domain-containing protein n=1 Tax=Mucilaginibacter ginsenosidivorax TaxID=862126 RepID=A0A5B8VU64_9SPHI|nr:alginate lyase family protein [Mucilaginibacter ginsenosidivorax]QEC75194.1 hypothetical protein FSB76_04260 [Mucilaginibacter ginsenosidivorax]
MKKILCGLGWIAMMLPAKAQLISLNDKELIVMRKTIHIDANDSSCYNKVFEPYLTAAKQALSQSPNPIKEILSQGLLEGDPKKTASLKAVEDAYKAYALAIVYKYNSNNNYLNKATEYLLAWAKTNMATGDPINETKLEDMVTAYDLVRNNIQLTNRVIIDKWMQSIADAEVNSDSAKPGKGTAINNWNSHRIKMITLITYTLHNHQYDSLITNELEKQLAVNLNPDGTTHDLLERDAFHYHIYDLEPLLTTCIAIYRATGKNYFTFKTANGASIKKSVDYMIPYMTGEKTHPEFANSKVSFDQKRAKNNEKGYIPGTLFNPQNGLQVFALASFFDESYLSVIARVASDGSKFFNWRMAINDFTGNSK